MEIPPKICARILSANPGLYIFSIELFYLIYGDEELLFLVYGAAENLKEERERGPKILCCFPRLEFLSCIVYL